MKDLKWLTMVLFAIVMTVGFIACSKNDDDPTSKSDSGTSTTTAASIVGKWKYEWDTGYTLITFNADGTGTYLEVDNGKQRGPSQIYYYYNSTENKLGESHSSLQDAQKYAEKITWIDSNSFKWGQDGNPKVDCVWKRQ